MKPLEKVFLWVVRVGIWVIPLLPFYVSSTMLFPFITGKNFAFRLIIEGIFPFWVGLAVMRPEYRPKLTSLVKVVTIFTVVVFFADLFGMNPYRSFFSNYERMEGFMLFGHLYLYFLMLVSVFRTRRDWLVFFHFSLAGSIAVAYIAILQKLGFRPALQGGFRVDSTIGNPTYLAAYMIFHMWLLLILMKQFLYRWWQAALYGILFVLDLAIVYFTATRGAAIALVVIAVPFMAGVILLWNRLFVRKAATNQYGKNVNRTSVSASAPAWSRGRMIAAGVLVFLVVAPAILFAMRKTDVIQSNPTLSRLTNYSFTEGTIQARFKIWDMAWQGFKARPILGWGQENFYLVFQKYFNPSLYGEEPWFDRSHNLIFDWLIHGGIAGLASYLAILGVVGWMIVRGIRKRAFPVWEGLILLGMFATYIIQNLFVFDNMNTYILFFAFLAYTHYLAYDVGDETKYDMADSRKTSLPRTSDTLQSYGTAIAIGLIAVMGIFGYMVNVKAMYEGRAVIDILRAVQGQKSIDEITGLFKKALDYGSFGDGEVREQLINVGQSIIASDKYSADDRKRYAAYVVDEMRKLASGPARDVKHVMYLGSFMDRAAALGPAYIGQAEQMLLDALNLSPAKQPTYFELARIYFATNRQSEAVDLLKKAWELDKSYDQATSSLWAAAVIAKRQDVLNELKSSVDLSKMREDNLERIGVGYRQAQDYQGATMIYAQLVKTSPNSAGYHATYAALLAQIGRADEAISEVKIAMTLDKSFEAEGKQFIDMLQKQKTPSQPKKTK